MSSIWHVFISLFMTIKRFSRLDGVVDRDLKVLQSITTINIVFTNVGLRRSYWRDSNLISLSTGSDHPLKSFEFNISTWKYRIRVPGNVRFEYLEM